VVARAFMFLSPLGERLGEGVNPQTASCITPLPQREGYFARPLPQGGEEHESKGLEATRGMRPAPPLNVVKRKL
jgi:hypothetical protein